MSRNNLLTTVLVSLLLVQAIATTATAQGPGLLTPDLVIDQIDSGANRVMGVHSVIRVTIRNIGDGPSTGDELFLGFNGWLEENCINTSAPVKRAGGTGCYTSIDQLGPAASRTLEINWNATRLQADDVAPKLHVSIARALGRHDYAQGTCATAVADNSQTCENNRRIQPGIVVKKPGIRAQPMRTASPTSDGNVQTAWKYPEVVDADRQCPPSTDASVDVGCFARPAMEVAGLYRITNLGNAADTFVSTFIDEATPRLGQAGIEVIPPPAFTLQPGELRDVKVLMRIPENASKGLAINGNVSLSKVRFASTLNPEITTATRDQGGCAGSTLCVDPTLPTVYVGAKFGFNITTNATWRPGLPGQPVSFNLTLNNTGNVFDRYVVRIDENTSATNLSWSPTITVPSQPQQVGERQDATISLVVPPSALNATYHLDVMVTSVGDRTASAKCIADEAIATFSEPLKGITQGVGLCRMRLIVHVGQTFALSSSGDAAASVVPDDSVTFRLQLTNTGNGFDNATLELQTNVFGWEPRLSTPVVSLTPFNTTLFTLTARPPPNTAAGLDGYFYVNATSVGRPEIGSDQRAKAPMIISRLTVLRGPNIVLSPVLNSSFVDPGKTADYDVTIRNTGNVADNFSLTTTTQSPDWSAAVTPSFLALGPTQEGTVRVTVRAPALGEVGETTKATLTATSNVDPSKSKPTPLDAQISGPDLFVSSLLVNSTTPYSGDPLEISVSLGNNGNKPADKPVNVRVEFASGGSTRQIFNKTYNGSELPGQRRLTETFVWNTTNIEGAGVLLARIDPDGAIAEIREDASSNEASKPLTLRTLDIRVTPAQGLSGRPGQRIVYGESPNVFTVEYSGNQPTELVTIQLISEHGWLVAEASELSVGLQRGTPLPIVATLDIPQLPGTNRDQLTLRVTPVFRPDTSITAAVTTTVIDEEKPRVAGLVVEPAATTLGTPVTITATFVDATGVSSATAFVTTPSNETSAVALIPVGGGRWQATQSYTGAGTYRVTVEALDNATPPLRNNSRDTVTTFALTPGSAPVIKLASGQATVIRTGGTVKINITDPLGIGKANYTIKGISYDLRAPDYALDTSSFPAGPLDVTVNAENIYGVRSSVKFALTVDNTPPGIKKVTLTPEKPLANQEVTVRIETDQTVQGVDVLIKKDGQVVETVPATRKSQGVFETKLTPGEGDYRIDVTAKDDAGNTKLQESAVQFSAKKDNVPAPAVGMLLAALVGIALLLRRRG